MSMIAGPKRQTSVAPPSPAGGRRGSPFSSLLLHQALRFRTSAAKMRANARDVRHLPLFEYLPGRTTARGQEQYTVDTMVTHCLPLNDAGSAFDLIINHKERRSGHDRAVAIIRVEFPVARQHRTIEHGVIQSALS